MPAITERSSLDLARAIRDRELTALDVVEAHIELLARTAATVNAVIANRFTQAREEARAADERVRSAERARAANAELPPLLGVPFTVKETIELKGMPNSAGLLARRDYRAPRTAPAVQRLIDAGAIPVGVTNTSELTLWIESENRLYGRTNNPYDATRTAGGSSGGEGAAVGSGGVPFGVASDIAGSIRIPALFCGVFGHKPSAGLVPNTGLWPPSTGTSGRMLGTGPLARRAEDLMPLLRIMAGPDGEDSLVQEVQLGDPSAVSLDGLQVTIVEDSSRKPIAQDLRDARERAVGALLGAGARLRTVRLRTWRGAVLPYLATLQAASGASSSQTIALLREAGEAAPTWRSLLRRSGGHTGPTRVALAVEKLPEQRHGPARERLLDSGRTLASELVEAIGDGVMLHPAQAQVAPRHGRTIGRPWLMTPAAIFNLAGVPVTEVPLGLSEEGLPTGVQVAAGPGADHLAIAVALELERVFGGWIPPKSG